MKYFIFCCAFIFPLLFAINVFANNTSEYPMDAVQKNMNRIQGYMQNHPPHLPTDNNTMQRPQTPYTPPTQPQTNTNTSLQDKAKLIELLNKVQLTEKEKQELITIILSK
ncbi:MAG: hypothetical protein ACERJ1_06035 [Halodesulfovibrio sp.]|uniref:hypothetical protein n=1 Tax=Halodesulfovibrio sp. TaxID=1912772 RepID=UPI00359D58F6